MKIELTKKLNRPTLTCTRDDGTRDVAQLGPTLPLHDLAHFVVERRLSLHEGFFGRVAAGFTMAQLSDKDFIKRSGAQPLVAEIAARALQALSSGACTPEHYAALVNAELSQWSIPQIEVDSESARSMLAELDYLASRYDALREGERLELLFDISSQPFVSHG